MKLDEAIELIQADIDDASVDWDCPLGKAYKLSFEALERLKELRKEREKVMPLAYLRNLIWKLLPSETEGGK